MQLKVNGIIVLYCGGVKEGEGEVSVRHLTDQDLFHYSSKLKGWQDKDGIEWESAKLDPLGSHTEYSMPADISR